MVLGKKFNKPILKYPSNLKYLTFGYDFNQDITDLPNSLERLVFGVNFNRCIDDLPDSITHLSFFVEINYLSDYYRFGCNKNTDYRPSGCEIHKSKFSQQITKLPKKITNLVLDTNKNFLGLENIISKIKLTHLQANNLDDNLLSNLSDTLEHLMLYSQPTINRLPSGLKSLLMNFTNCLELLTCLLVDLEMLILITRHNCFKNYNNYPYDLSNLPLRLKYLKIIDDNTNNYYNFDYLPGSITHLTLDLQTNYLLNNLPNSITHLWIDSISNQELFHPQDNIKELYTNKEYIEKHFNSINKNIVIKNISDN